MATQAQIDFLAVLHGERGLDFDAEAYVDVSNKDASADIDTLIRDVGSSEPPTEEQLSEIATIREYLGPRDEDTVPTDSLGASRLLFGLRKAQFARRRQESRERFAARGTKLVERNEQNVNTSDEAPAIVVAEQDEIPF